MAKKFLIQVVGCSLCGAKKGQPCHFLTNKRITIRDPHKVRVDAYVAYQKHLKKGSKVTL